MTRKIKLNWNKHDYTFQKLDKYIEKHSPCVDKVNWINILQVKGEAKDYIVKEK